MQVAALIPIAVFALVGGAVSLRLLLLWRRTREFPELCIGLGKHPECFKRLADSACTFALQTLA